MKKREPNWCIWIKYDQIGWYKEATIYPVAGYSAKWLADFYLRHIYQKLSSKTERVLLEGRKPRE